MQQMSATKCYSRLTESAPLRIYHALLHVLANVAAVCLLAGMSLERMSCLLEPSCGQTFWVGLNREGNSCPCECVYSTRPVSAHP